MQGAARWTTRNSIEGKQVSRHCWSRAWTTGRSSAGCAAARRSDASLVRLHAEQRADRLVHSVVPVANTHRNIPVDAAASAA
jgi:hypothetical protein